MPDNSAWANNLSTLLDKFLNDNCTVREAGDAIDKLEDPGNDIIFKREAVSFMNSSPGNMDTGNSMDNILVKLHNKIDFSDEGRRDRNSSGKNFLYIFSKIAAILFIPVLLYSIYLTFFDRADNEVASDTGIWQTIKVPAGSQTEFSLPDGSYIWLNSGSVFKYPSSFNKDFRNVELTGEGYFDIRHDPEHPFRVNAGKLNIDVKGTRFVVINYPDDPAVEVILESGNVLVSTADKNPGNGISLTETGEKATYNNSDKKISVEKDDIDKYTSWREGIMIFRDDPMSEVARRLSHRFNVEIVLNGDDIKDYVYTATFKNESLNQILELLKISAPLKLTRTEQKFLNDSSFSKSKIIITKI